MSRMAALSLLRSARGKAPFGFTMPMGNVRFRLRAIVNYLTPPSFAADGKTLYYLLQHPPAGSGPELWRTAVDSGRSEPVFPGISMTAYDVSPDGRQVVYATATEDGKSQLWIAAIDRSSPAKQIGNSGETSPYFGPEGEILFQLAEGNLNYLERMNPDGSGRSKVVPYPIIEIVSVSPGRKWLTAVIPYPEVKAAPATIVAIPLDGGPPRRICSGYCVPKWSSSGKFLFVDVEAASQTNPGRSLAIPIGPGETLPELPPRGIPPGAAPSVVPGSQSIRRENFVPGADLNHYAVRKQHGTQQSLSHFSTLNCRTGYSLNRNGQRGDRYDSTPNSARVTKPERLLFA